MKLAIYRQYHKPILQNIEYICKYNKQGISIDLLRFIYGLDNKKQDWINIDESLITAVFATKIIGEISITENKKNTNRFNHLGINNTIKHLVHILFKTLYKHKINLRYLYSKKSIIEHLPKYFQILADFSNQYNIREDLLILNNKVEVSNILPLGNN